MIEKEKCQSAAASIHALGSHAHVWHVSTCNVIHSDCLALIMKVEYYITHKNISDKINNRFRQIITKVIMLPSHAHCNIL